MTPTKLAPVITINQDDQKNRGIFTPSKQLTSITLTWKNLSTNVLRAFFGDFSGLVAEVHKLGARVHISAETPAGTIVNATSGNRGVMPASMEKNIAFSPISINGLILKSTVSSAQLDNDIEFFTANMAGNKDNNFISLAEYTTENQYNEKVKTISLPEELEMNGSSALAFDLNPSETVTMTLKIKRTRRN